MHWSANNMRRDGEVTLTVNGIDYGGWKEVSIGAGIERQARDFSVSLTWKWPGSLDRNRVIRQGDRCEVRIDGELIMTGHVDATPVRWNKQEISTAIAGRSLTADLVDCAAINAPGQWVNQPPERIVRALAEPYGIAVLSEIGEVDWAGMLADHTIQPGESAFESIDRLLRLSRLLSTDDAQGRLVLARPGSAGRAVDRLERGVNLLSGDAPLNFAGVYSEYVCKGQRAGNDTVFGVDASEVEASVTDPRMTRRRVLMVSESGQMTPALARQRVEWERGSRIARALQSSYEVQGWRQSDGSLWRHNLIVRVVDPLVGFDRDLLIAEIEYRKSNSGGTVTRMTVAPPEGFEAEPPDPAKRQRGRKKADDFEYLLPVDWEQRKQQDPQNKTQGEAT